jgi:hypothetical protein
MSQGEGFGLPTIECAAIGKLQIVNNHTTMPELLGRSSPMLVDPAMTEDKMGSLWQVPNTEAMVNRTMILLGQSDIEIRETALDAARERVNQKFNAPLVIGKFVDLFKTEIAMCSRSDLHHIYPHGYQTQHIMGKVWDALGRVVRVLTKGNVLEVGSFTGEFVGVCESFGLSIHGIEADNMATFRIPKRLREFVREQPFEDDWPFADLVVCTDIQDRWFAREGMTTLQNMLERVSYYEWACLRWKPMFRWGKHNVGEAVCRNILEAKGMVRRVDIEKLLRVKFPEFDHEIWRRGGDTVFMPESLRRFSDASSCSRHTEL